MGEDSWRWRRELRRAWEEVVVPWAVAVLMREKPRSAGEKQSGTEEEGFFGVGGVLGCAGLGWALIVRRADWCPTQV